MFYRILAVVMVSYTRPPLRPPLPRRMRTPLPRGAYSIFIGRHHTTLHPYTGAPQVLAWFPIQRTIITEYLRSMYTITSYAQHLRFQRYTALSFIPGPPPAPPSPTPTTTLTPPLVTHTGTCSTSASTRSSTCRGPPA